MVEAQHHHRSTLKQKNKPFKSKHATKTELRDKSKGKIARQSPKSSPNANAAAAQLRVNRKNTAKQVQLKKRQELVSATRIFNGIDGTPRIVAVVPLTPDVNARNVVRALAASLDVDSESCPESGLWKMQATRFKTSLQFTILPYRRFYSIVDACKAADYVLFAMSDSVEVDPWGDTLLRTLQAQGLPSVVSCMATSDPDSNAKERSSVAKSLLSFISYFVPSQTRIFDLAGPSSSSECLTAVRALCEGRPGDIRWREGRPWLLAEDLDFTRGASTEQQDASSIKGVLKVTGIVRGNAPLDVNRLVHLVGVGDFQVDKITAAPLPRTAHRKSKNAEPGMDVDLDLPEIILAEADEEEADSLVSTNELDNMAGEQTWPTEEEMAHSLAQNDNSDKSIPDALVGTTPKSVRRVNGKKMKRTSEENNEYMASWIIEDGDDEDEDEGDQLSAGDIDMNGAEEMEDAPKDVAEEEDMDDEDEDDRLTNKTSGKTVAFEDLDDDEEAEQLKAWLDRPRGNASEEENDEREDAEFPDEVDTPRDVPARERFARYRGLRSLRTSPWDPYENLPKDYGRVFALEDWRKVERAVKRRAMESNSPVTAGERVTIHLCDVPESDAAPLVERSKSDAKPTVLFGLFEHEHKMTVLNFTVQRNTEYSEPVKSKDPMVLCYGPRRLCVGPIYSQLNRNGGGKGANNVHKFERWLRHSHAGASVMTTYAPVCFGGGGLGGGGVPCTLLRGNVDDEQAPHLVAMGAFLNSDTTRINAKRIILTGHPFKVHKKTATVRYMFFNYDDVSYFKPIQLYTKYGRTGHIRSSLGTHGYYKAHFDGPINQMDTVCMALYKRVYPRWPTAWRENGTGWRQLGAGEPGAGEAVAMEE